MDRQAHDRDNPYLPEMWVVGDFWGGIGMGQQSPLFASDRTAAKLLEKPPGWD